jgi:mono/diheme cytochrome c family protein
MKRSVCGFGVVIALFLFVQAGPTPAAQTPTANADASVAQRAVIDRNCVACHNQRNKTNAGNLDLSAIDLSHPARHPEVFENVVAKLKAGLMPPPATQRQLTPAARASLITYLETDLDRAAELAPNPGRTEAFHRLNRAEYQNAVRDLLGVHADVTPLLPSDDASFGFDNMAGVLRISEARLEQYLSAAVKVSSAALGSSEPVPTPQVYRIPETTNQYETIEGLPFGTRGGLVVRHEFPQDGEYEISIELRCRIAGECDGSVGFADEHHLLLSIDGTQVVSFTLEPRKTFRPRAERVWRARVVVKAGPRDVIATFQKLPSIREIDSAYERFLRPYFLNGNTNASPSQTVYQPFIDTVTITGAFDATGPGRTPSRQRILVCKPQDVSGPRSNAPAGEDVSCARAILSRLARRAFRRPVTDADLKPLMAMYRSGAAESGFDGGIEAALQWLLVSPEFLFRIERDPASTPPSTNYRISDLELASRLSFFLWSSIPDEQLLVDAERGRLSNPVVYERHVRRMLGDRRTDALVKNFAGQWLLLRNLDAHRPDVPLFPNYDDTLRDAARQETELLFGAVLRGNRPALELLTADYTFMNERLARHYGIEDVYGSEFRRVAVADDNRRGILGHASILTVTSRPNRTSPVLRGKWILENVLGTPAPAPPPNVPSLVEQETGTMAKLGTMRQRMSMHRANPVCAGCHAMIDPSGFALENFDAVGKWRDVDDSGTTVDASGSLPDGTRFNNLRSFRAALLRDPDVFTTTVTRKLMTYALGRGLEPSDMPVVRRIVRDARPGGSTLSDIVMAIVRSIPFQMRRTGDANQ